jgi:hypothetical protein
MDRRHRARLRTRFGGMPSARPGLHHACPHPAVGKLRRLAVRTRNRPAAAPALAWATGRAQPGRGGREVAPTPVDIVLRSLPPPFTTGRTSTNVHMDQSAPCTRPGRKRHLAGRRRYLRGRLQRGAHLAGQVRVRFRAAELYPAVTSAASADPPHGAGDAVRPYRQRYAPHRRSFISKDHPGYGTRPPSLHLQGALDTCIRRAPALSYVL